MGKIKVSPPLRMQALTTGQIWRVGELHLQVGRVGPHLVHYKLAKPDAVRIPNLIHGKAAVEKYLKRNKAVLLQA